MTIALILAAGDEGGPLECLAAPNAHLRLELRQRARCGLGHLKDAFPSRLRHRLSGPQRHYRERCCASTGISG